MPTDQPASTAAADRLSQSASAKKKRCDVFISKILLLALPGTGRSSCVHGTDQNTLMSARNRRQLQDAE
jgi:hypothetical protein